VCLGKTIRDNVRPLKTALDRTYKQENTGNKYRASLAQLSGVNTFPQVFINGAFYGGAVRQGHTRHSEGQGCFG
jgi:glutaredoxin-related protein